ncbi:flagellar M-ring protein FliF [Sphingomonas koreensis]|nr:flagellar M-ring protein FliF [Sphingomonas koreensis]TPG41290.1 flagellar M-ring protein FliF [Sphingomonas koreensis]
MSTSLTPTASGALPERFANPLKQIGGLMAQPAVRRSLPMILMIGLIAAAGLAWMMLSTPPQRTLFPNLADSDKAAVTAALSQASIANHLDADTGAITVSRDDYSKARMLLASQDLPKAAPGGYAILDNMPMGTSRAVEGERLRQARESELAQSIEAIDAVDSARVHLAMPEETVFVRDNASPSASVVLKLQPGRTLDDAQVSSIVNLVASSVPGMKPDAVTIVDQTGDLLSKPGGADPATVASDDRIAFQNRVEEKYRTQLVTLLTPIVGAGNFSAEVQADVDLDQTQATRESYDKDGVLRAEQGNWTTNAGDAQPAAGIPGALSNTPPPASIVTAPGAQPAAGAAAPGAAPAAGATTPATGPMPDAQKASDNFTRAYDLGREVSVTQATPGAVKRLSVAVVLRDPGTGKPRSQAELNQLTQLVRAAVGYDQSRNDQVTVIASKFAGADADAASTPWYQASWIPMVLRNLTAIVVALLVLLFGVRPLAKSLLKKREDVAQPRLALGREDGALPADGGPAVSLDMLESGRGYDDRVGLVRGFTRDNPARAALAVRDMIRSDGQ